jgi:hypothetical protein
VQKNDWRTTGRTGLRISDIQGVGIDLLQCGKRSVRSGLDRRQPRRFCRAGLCIGKPSHAEVAGSDRHNRGAKEAAAVLVYFLRLRHPIHGQVSMFR